jgi:hypothetical protein
MQGPLGVEVIAKITDILDGAAKGVEGSRRATGAPHGVSIDRVEQGQIHRQWFSWNFSS